jgi:hypothetical protein
MPEMTPYHQIAELVSWLRDKTASDEEVEQHLRILEADLGMWAQKLRSLSLPAGVDPSPMALVEESLQAIDLFSQSIAHVREYMSSRVETAADTALAEARQGIEQVLRVKGVTEENIERILDEASAS